MFTNWASCVWCISVLLQRSIKTNYGNLLRNQCPPVWSGTERGDCEMKCPAHQEAIWCLTALTMENAEINLLWWSNVSFLCWCWNVLSLTFMYMRSIKSYITGSSEPLGTIAEGSLRLTGLDFIGRNWNNIGSFIFEKQASMGKRTLQNLLSPLLYGPYKAIHCGFHTLGPGFLYCSISTHHTVVDQKV